MSIPMAALLAACAIASANGYPAQHPQEVIYEDGEVIDTELKKEDFSLGYVEMACLILVAVVILVWLFGFPRFAKKWWKKHQDNKPSFTAQHAKKGDGKPGCQLCRPPCRVRARLDDQLHYRMAGPTAYITRNAQGDMICRLANTDYSCNRSIIFYDNKKELFDEAPRMRHVSTHIHTHREIVALPSHIHVPPQDQFYN